MSFRILIVEDEPLVAIALQSVLQEAGFETAGPAATREAALAIAAEQRVDAATMDVQLARGGSGVETALDLFRLHGIRSLFISGSLTARICEEADPAAPLGFLSKPCDLDQVVRILTVHLARRPVAG